MEETGREILWPAAIERIFSSPFVTLFGVGLSNVAMDIIRARNSIPPHNTFLFFALSSGVVPLAFFIAFWIQAVWRAAHAKSQEGDSFRIPYLIFAFVGAMFGDLGFMSPWGLLALSVGAGSVLVYATASRSLYMSVTRLGMDYSRPQSARRRYHSLLLILI